MGSGEGLVPGRRVRFRPLSADLATIRDLGAIHELYWSRTIDQNEEINKLSICKLSSSWVPHKSIMLDIIIPCNMDLPHYCCTCVPAPVYVCHVFKVLPPIIALKRLK